MMDLSIGKPAMQLTPTAEAVLKRRYYQPGEDWTGLCERVAGAVAQKEVDPYWYRRYFYMLRDLDFLPNSPCLMNAGMDIGQLTACFVLPVEDSMDGIFTAIRNGALVHKTGGGTGYSFSRLRPKNSAVRSTQGVASGPMSFINVFDAATETIKQGGKRRGANMGVLRVDHPDIMDFIRAKETDGVLSNFNLSVAITDEFMRGVESDGEYPLVDPRDDMTVGHLRARDVFEEIVSRAWSNGEPGVLFIDAANRANPTPQLGDYEATNPCGEQWLLPYESCNLGSINLSNFVNEGSVDWYRLREVTRIAVRFLDSVIDVTKFPIPEIEAATKKTRKIGLGIMGLHDMLIQLGLPYDSDKGRTAAADVMSHIKTTAERASEDLAVEKGTYPVRDSNRRNAAITSIQPTGTVSMIADCASGCEPYFAVVTEKTVMDGDKFLMVNKHFEAVAREGGWYSEDLMQRVKESGTVLGHTEIPENWQQIFKTAQDIAPEDHIKMQITLQNNGVDSSISKTINLPSTATKEDVRAAYLQAWEGNCKGLTVYRDGSRNNQVLTAGPTPETITDAPKTGHVPPAKRVLPDVMDAKRYRLKGKSNENIYITICHDKSIPMEVFAKFPYDNRDDQKDKATMWTTVCRLVSLGLRYGIPAEQIIKQFDRSSGNMFDLPAQLSKLLKQFRHAVEPCPECGAEAVVYEEGCQICRNCGWSKCS